MKIAAVQMVSTPELERNLETAGRLISEAAAEGARLVALPEYFCIFGRSDRDKLAVAESAGDGPIQRALSRAARAHGVWIIGGTLPMRIPGNTGQVRNACCVVAPDGRQVARYDKMHLFSFDNGSERYEEASTLEAGSEAVAFDIADADGAGSGALRVGLSVCYDLRFPELYRALSFGPQACGPVARTPCDLFAVPAAFTHTTGQAHWELLLRARAVENQAYVIAPAQGGRHENGRRTWGHSMIVDPWGTVLACLASGEGVVTAEIDRARLAEVRRQLPALAHRRDQLIAKQ